MKLITKLSVAILSIAVSTSFATAQDNKEFLNVSYDVMRDFYKEYNPLFLKHYEQTHQGATLKIQQSHGGSSKQALSVANGLQADVVTMNQSSDVELLESKGLIQAGWDKEFPDHAVPFTSTTVFLVRKGNPKHIKDWEDLTKEGIQVVIANPKTTGNGRYTFLAAYGAALKANNNDHEKAKALVKGLFKNVPVLDNGGRAATTTFVKRQIGDALITFENEANMAAREFGKDEFELVYPKYSIKAENPVAIVDTVVAKKGSAEVAKDYLAYLWSEPAQELAATLYLRPSNPTILAKYKDRFPHIDTFRANDVFGTWPEIMKTYFADGGVFDQIQKP
ncbi:sulfate ABC transporter substrate-binding protein [Pelistega indica]|uniref:Sulfate ABC transporter substrate-binding protein n=1 Tax=Pelistega indica TaxID=1414851 RepID=V8FTB7_9BURK|nr:MULTISPECIES: sulfate ABC transporter substrate-binding protein [Pelistega]ETD66662.1 sulfate ABC transporter substrate-binding protein [Pelistega indica]